MMQFCIFSGTEGMVESFGSLTPSTPLGVDQMRLVEGENSAQSRGAGTVGPSVGEDEEDREQPGSLQGELAIVSAAVSLPALLATIQNNDSDESP